MRWLVLRSSAPGVDGGGGAGRYGEGAEIAGALVEGFFGGAGATRGLSNVGPEPAALLPPSVAVGGALLIGGSGLIAPIFSQTLASLRP